ncbi:MAG: ATP-binding cassette domain-containing protein [Elusimicrobia bacterium]|nr:ATP-binding cassette domain-containing protein [Elusimicrobiota bacterium]
MIEIRGLYKNFGSQQVLKGINLDINDGEIFTLLGGSGGGKSVFLKNVIGLLTPDGGSIKIDGEEIVGLKQKNLTKIQTKFGMLFQGGALFDSLTVGENVAFGLRRLTDFSDNKIRGLVIDYLEMVNLKGVEDKLPESLSIGMKRRVALARAIATSPKYIFYDEPTTGLDPITTDVISDLFLELQQKLKPTSVMVTHDLQTAYKVSDRIALLYDGVIVEVSTTEAFKKSTNPHVVKFIEGSSKGLLSEKNKD